MDVKRLLQNMGIVAILVASTRVFGFIRDLIMTPTFGLGQALDAWNVAFTIFSTVALLITTGILSAVFIPIFRKHVVKNEDEKLRKLIGVLLAIITIGFSAIVLLAFIFAKPLIMLQIPDDMPAETIRIAVKLFRIMAPTLLIMAWTGLATAIHHSFNRFILPAVGGLLLNISVAGALFFLAGFWGIETAAYGFLVGSVIQLLVQLPKIYGKKLRFNINLVLSHPSLNGVKSLILPVFLASGINHIGIFFAKYLAGGVAVGAISAYQTAWRVGQLPISIFVFTVSMVVYPAFAEAIAKNNPDELKRKILLGLKLVSIIIIPAAIGILILSDSIIMTLFMRGEVGYEQVLRIARPLAFMAIGMLAWALTAVFLKVFYSLGDTKTPVWIALVTIFSLVCFQLLLLPWGLVGIALGAVLSAFIGMLLQIIMIRKRIGNFGLTSLIITIIKSTIAAGVMGVALLFISQKAPLFVDMSSNTGRILALTFSIVAGGIIYMVVMYFINRDELKNAFSSLKSKKVSA